MTKKLSLSPVSPVLLRPRRRRVNLLDDLLLVEGGLVQPLIPPQAPHEALEPIGRLVRLVDARHRVVAHPDHDGVPLAQLHPILAVEARPRRPPGGLRHPELQLGAVRQQHRPEGQRVGADGSEEDGGDARVDDGTARRDGVRGAPRRRRQQDPVPLDLGDQPVPLVALDHAQVRVGPAVHADLVQDLKPLPGHRLALPHDLHAQPHPEGDEDATERGRVAAVAHVRQVLVVLLMPMVCQKTERAEVEADDGRHGAGKEVGSVKNDPVAAEADHEVHELVQLSSVLLVVVGLHKV
mmetsp:Transcript_10582/g.37547  ORF Transcript_10582/g.37547 Transcript_10582/m.37547 type:complete len:295 (-) Transcript_10582:581-1465(-)